MGPARHRRRRQLRRSVRAQPRNGHAHRPGARAQRPVDSGRPTVRATAEIAARPKQAANRKNVGFAESVGALLLSPPPAPGSLAGVVDGLATPFAFGSILTVSSTAPFDWRRMFTTFTV